MAIPLASAVTVCSTCGEPLNAKGNCVACLLRTALDESVVEANLDVSFVFGDFEIVRHEDGSFCELGRGAMGVTYLARDNVLRRKVALKVIDVPAAARGSQAVRERFLREARSAAALRHLNVAAVFQFGGFSGWQSLLLRHGIGRGRNPRESRTEGWSTQNKTGFGNCDPNLAGIDGCGSSRLDPSRPKTRQYHVDAR